MDFSFTEEQALLLDTARRAAREIFDDATIRKAVAEPDSVRCDAWRSITELGWAGILVPADFGGSGGSVVDACILAEVLAGALAPVPFTGTAIAAAALLNAANDSQSCADLAEGQAFSIALDRELRTPAAEPVLAWDWLDGAEVIEIADDGKAVRTSVIPRSIGGIDPLHPLATVEGLTPETHETPAAVRRARAIAMVGFSAAALGLAAAALDEAVSYAKERVQYGRPIAEFQAVQHIAADMLVDVEACRSIVYGAAWTVEHGDLDEAERVAAVAKAWCGPAAIRSCESGIQVLGGIGVTWEHNAHLRLRHAQLLNHVLGGPEACYDAVLVTTERG